MRSIRIAIFAGAAAVLLSGVVSFAAAKDLELHTMTLRLPGGAAEQIRYTGDVPPDVVIEPQSLPIAFGWPGALASSAPFAMLDRISADMNREMNETMRQMDALAAQSVARVQTPTAIGTGELPAGSESYSFVSMGGGKMFCARSVEVTSRGTGEKPHVVSRSYGDCGSRAATEGTRSRADAAARQDAARSIDYVRSSPSKVLREASLAQ